MDDLVGAFAEDLHVVEPEFVEAPGEGAGGKLVVALPPVLQAGCVVVCVACVEMDDGIRVIAGCARNAFAPDEGVSIHFPIVS